MPKITRLTLKELLRSYARQTRVYHEPVSTTVVRHAEQTMAEIEDYLWSVITEGNE